MKRIEPAMGLRGAPAGTMSAVLLALIAAAAPLRVQAAPEDFRTTSVPEISAPDAPPAVDSGGLDFRSLDPGALDKYNSAFELDRSADPEPSEKARAWRQLAHDVRQFAEMAAKRAAQWEAVAAAVQKRVEARDSDWARLGPLLSASAIPEEDKTRWSAVFLTAYWTSPGVEPEMADELSPHVKDGPMRAALDARPERKAGIRWVKIPGGSFMMGSSDADLTGARPLHRVTVNPFRMAKTLVTNKQYRACVAAGACSPPHDFDGKCWVRRPGAVAYGGWSLGKLPDSFKGDDQPAVCVDWKQADDFSAWAGGRLPSEAEWEYAARGAGRDQKYPWGDEDPTCARAETKACGKAATAPVCSRPSGDTRQGLCDMAGNAWEFVLDSYHDTYDGAPQDGRAWEFGGTSRVNRGGSWSDDADVVRSAHRGRAPDAGNFTVGFRPAR